MVKTKKGEESPEKMLKTKTKKGEQSPEICFSHKSEDSLERMLRQRKGSRV
jgi:hypothetical protein